MLPKMRGLAEAIKELHDSDPESCFTLHALRKLVNEGELPCVRCGRRILINMDSLYEYLRGEQEQVRSAPPPKRYGVIQIAGKRA